MKSLQSQAHQQIVAGGLPGQTRVAAHRGGRRLASSSLSIEHRSINSFVDIVKSSIFLARNNRRVGAKVAAAASVVDVLANSSPTTSPWDAEYQAAVDAVRLASKLCQAVQCQLKSGEKTQKDDSSPVTVADYGAQVLVSWSLQRSLPHQTLSMIAEEDSADLRAPEGAAMLRRITDLVNDALADEEGSPLLTQDEVADLVDAGASDGGPVGRHWVLDPIDGTRGFVGMRQYAVCLGLLVDGDVKMGVLGCPNLPQWAISDVDCSKGTCKPYNDIDDGVGCLFGARLGCGSFAGPLFNVTGLPTVRVQCDDTLPPEEVRFMESFEAKHSNHTISAAVATEIGLELPSLRLDSQAKYGALSRGDASIFMRFPPDTYREKIWDHAAGAIILTEAGGCISDAMGNPLDFSQGRFFPYLNGGLIAATPSMHKAILAALRKIRGEE